MRVAPSSSATLLGTARHHQRVQIFSGLDPGEMTRITSLKGRFSTRVRAVARDLDERRGS